MSDAFFYATIGGAIMILIYGGLQIVRRYPRVQKTVADHDEHLYAVAQRAWETGKPVVGTVDDAGNLTMCEDGAAWPDIEVERERIKKREVCSDKSHWRSPISPESEHGIGDK